MVKLLLKSKIIVISLLFSIICEKTKAQCSILSSVNASALVCGSIPLTSCNGQLIIGDGVNGVVLNMNTALDLTCLGTVQLIIKNNASINFSAGNNRLYLATGSSLFFEGNGKLNGAGCNASERIFIGTNLLASCDGNGGASVSFSDIISLGGTGYAVSNTPVCIGNSIVLSAVPPPKGGAYTFSWSGPGLTPTPFTSNPLYTLTASAANAGYYQVAMKSPIVANPMVAQTLVSVNTGVTTIAPTVIVEQPSCTANTGKISITNPMGIGMTYSIDGVSYTNTTGIFNSLPVGNYSVTAKNSSGCISPSVNVNLAVPTTVWDGVSWSNGLPTDQKDIIFNGDSPLTLDVEGCSCQVNSGAVTVSTGRTMTITNGVTVSGGSLTFEDKASLVQVNDAALNVGSIIYKRVTPAVSNTDYTYWSCPVTGVTLGALSPNTLSGKMYSFNAFASSPDWQQESSATIMAVGKGYIVRGPEYIAPLPPFPAPFLATFSGVPNNGNLSVPIGPTGTSNLIGNPYPSALDADTFLTFNNTILGGTIYFWTHNTPIQLATDITDGSAGSGSYAYTSNDYASYNLTGGVGIGTAASTTSLNPNLIPSGKIGSGQSFFTTSISTGKLVTFNNSMRVGVGLVTGDNSQFFKSTVKAKKEKGAEKNRIWLNLSNSQGAFKQTLIGYVSGATNDFDNGYDGFTYNGNPYLDFYSLNKDQNLVIQGRALPFIDSDTIALGYRSAISGDFKISIDKVDGFFKGKSIYLMDHTTNSMHDLQASDFIFKTEKGTYNNRFTLKYTKKDGEKDDVDTAENTLVISSKNNAIKIKSLSNDIEEVKIYDLLGRQIYKSGKINDKEFIIQDVLSNGILILLKANLSDGKIITKKVIH
ncbi:MULTISPECIES: T9SS sorting signal type C domain-containing protein [unclassified Flavobacterium]|uniref:T9SS sorting signal type C domain-containing protein n=1 Tax=unclassified Flavobacterium TaxID=196869 RepID=UPI003F90C239